MAPERRSSRGRRRKSSGRRRRGAGPTPPERRTPLYDIHLRTASRMVAGGGNYLFPWSYTSPVEEHTNTRTNVGMQDLSTMGEVDVKGPGAERLLNRLLVIEIRDMEPGQVRYSTMVNEDGGIVDDVTLYKFSDEHYMVVTSSGPRKVTARWIADHALGASAYATEISTGIALISVQGPRSRDFLAEHVQDVDIEMLRFFRFAPAVINGSEIILSRTGYTGELGYELYVPSDEAAALWLFLEAQGKEYGLLPYGVEAMQSLRIEKAYPLYGPDIDQERSPFELGLQRWIDFDKRDFVGRDALLEIQQRGLDERWTGLALESPSPARTGDPIYAIADIATFREKMFTGAEAGDYFDREEPGQQVGEVTSSARGHSVGKTLALGFVDVSHSWPGNNLLIDVDGRPVLAKVEPTPFFDPEGVRLRARGPRNV